MHVSVDALDGGGVIVATTWRHVNFSVIHGCASALSGAVSEPIPSPSGGFAQKVGFGADFLVISGLNLTILFPILSFWAKPSRGERGQRAPSQISRQGRVAV
jgi:hypothetical protein